MESYLGQIVTVALFSIGGIGGYFTFRANVGESARRIAALEHRADEAERDVAAFRLKISEEYVRTSAMEKLEDRLGRMIEAALKPMSDRMEKIDHQMRGIDQKLTDRMVNILRAQIGGKDSQ